jgi:hypothetical protein
MHACTGYKSTRAATGSSLKDLGLEPRCRVRRRQQDEMNFSPCDCMNIVEQSNISQLFA